MNSPAFGKNICRICLDEAVVIDWSTTLYGYCDITYKDCFYKYTQLEYQASDPFSTMICQNCLNGLYNVHTFISKALESNKYFQEANSTNMILEHSANFKDNTKYTPTGFETVLIEKIKVEPIIQDHFVYEPSDEEFLEQPIKNQVGKRSKWYREGLKLREKLKSFKYKKAEETIALDQINAKYNPSKPFNESVKKTRRKCENLKIKEAANKNDNISENLNILGEHIKEDQTGDLDDVKENSSEQLKTKTKKKYKEIKKPRMCSICSKILHNKYAVQMHEKTHIENRERRETCKICGLKFYDKRNLYSHKRIHKENREKVHKCEFCSKAFYNKGGLNVHRRIHLGQMIPCSLCSKQYFRQIDLDRHMSSHSATTINSNTKKRSRYFVRCKHCDKSILSTSFKSHTAAHLNEPLMKCSICNKEYFSRGSCVLHVKKVHQKTNEEYNDFIILYKKNRISHLFLEQKADIQFTEE